MKVIHLAGKPYVRGQEYGEHLKDTICELVAQDRMGLEKEIQTRTGITLSDEDWLSMVRRYLVFAEDYAPDLVEEMRGIANGASISFEQLFAFNAFLDLNDLSSRPLTSKLLIGCTTFAASSTATRESGAYLGQTYDWRTSYRKGSTMLRHTGPNGLSILLFTFAGLLGCAGINSAGLGIVINKLTPSDSRPGVPYPFVLRKALEQTNIADAIGMIANCERASGIFYLLADASGEIIGIETTATDFEVLYAMEDYLGHSNHYVHPRLLDYDQPNRRLKTCTFVRWSRINKLLERARGQIGLNDLMDFTRDHAGSSNSICHHPDDGVQSNHDTYTFSTNAGLIMDLKSLKLWVASGNPCISDYKEFRFSG